MTSEKKPRIARSKRAKRALLSGPGFLWLFVFFVAPLVFPFYYSLTTPVGAGGPQVTGFPSGDSFRLLSDPVYAALYPRTLVQAVTATLAIMIAGFPVAYFLATRAQEWKFVLLALVVLPAWTSFLIRAYAWLVLLGAGGPIASSLEALGVTEDRPQLLFTRGAVFVGLLSNYLPLAVLPLWAALERLDPSLREASSDVGATPFRTLRQVTLPLASPGILVAAILVFIPMIGEYVIPTLLGGHRVALAGTVIVNQFQQARDWSLGSALALALVALALTLIGLVAFVLRPTLRRAAS